MNESDSGFEKQLEDTIEKEIGGRIEKAIEKYIPKYAEGLIEAIILLITGFLINKYYVHFDFLTSDFEKILPYINFNIALTIVFALGKMFIYSQVYKKATSIINNIVFIYIAYLFWTIYPFDTSGFQDSATWDKIINGIIILSVIGTLIGSVGDLVKIFSPDQKKITS
jgi:hypothetical protein